MHQCDARGPTGGELGGVRAPTILRPNKINVFSTKEQSMIASAVLDGVKGQLPSPPHPTLRLLHLAVYIGPEVTHEVI